MTTKNDFTAAAQAEILDSLADARDNHENAWEAMAPGDSAEMAARLAYAFGSRFYIFRDGIELDSRDLGLIREALQLSIDNCDEQGLDDAMAGYESALEELDALS